MKSLQPLSILTTSNHTEYSMQEDVKVEEVEEEGQEIELETKEEETKEIPVESKDKEASHILNNNINTIDDQPLI